MNKLFDLKDWVDYVRGIAPAERAAAMAASLTAGEPDARELHRIAASLAQSAQWRREVEVPPAVLRRAEALLATSMTGKAAGEGLLPLTLLFDSLLSPQRAGLRSAAGAGPRRLTYRAGDFELGLRLEYLAPAGHCLVMGYLAPQSGRPAGVFAIRAVRGERTVGETTSTAGGEFQLELTKLSRSRLVLELADPPRRIEVPLSEPPDPAQDADP